ncbi:MAG: hypothetical protein H5T83_05090 [Actinotalea sp.]|nr:hypothetical protein [Actinotalea sp.]
MTGSRAPGHLDDGDAGDEDDVVELARHQGRRSQVETGRGRRRRAEDVVGGPALPVRAAGAVGHVGQR